MNKVSRDKFIKALETGEFKGDGDMFTKLWENGVRAEIEIYEGAGHGWFNKAPHLLPVLSRAEAFIVKYFEL